MPFCDHVVVNDNRLEICDNVMQCVCCSYFLENLKVQATDDILVLVHNLPNEVTRIRIPIFPIPNNVPYYSYAGIEYLITTLFKEYKGNNGKKSGGNKPFLKLYFEKNSLFILPIIQIEIIFLENLSVNTSVKFLEILESEISNIIGANGILEPIQVTSKTHLSELLKTPLLYGYPEFKLSGVLAEHCFTDEQVLELNYLHTYIPQILNFEGSNKRLSLDFLKPQKTVIQEKLQNQQSEEEKIRDEVIRTLFEGGE